MADIITPPARGAFVQVFEPKAMQNPDGTSGKPKYSLTLLFPHGFDLKPFEKSVQEFLLASWGADQSKWPSWAFTTDDEGKRKLNREKLYGFKPQGNKTYVGYTPGAWYITPTTDNKPDIRLGRRGADGKLLKVTDESEVYGGAWYQCVVQPYLRKVKTNPGLSYDLRSVVKLRDDEPFVGSRTDTDKEFSAVQFEDGGEFASSEKGASDLFD